MDAKTATEQKLLEGLSVAFDAVFGKDAFGNPRKCVRCDGAASWTGLRCLTCERVHQQERSLSGSGERQLSTVTSGEGNSGSFDPLANGAP